jgi:predicted peptidase
MYDACVFPDANSRIDAAGKHTPDQSADYKAFEYEYQIIIKDGTLTSGINNITVASKANGIYNIAGQQMNGLQKGINIVDGKKVFIK